MWTCINPYELTWAHIGPHGSTQTCRGSYRFPQVHQPLGPHKASPKCPCMALPDSGHSGHLCTALHAFEQLSPAASGKVQCYIAYWKGQTSQIHTPGLGPDVCPLPSSPVPSNCCYVCTTAQLLGLRLRQRLHRVLLPPACPLDGSNCACTVGRRRMLPHPICLGGVCASGICTWTCVTA